MTYYALTDSDWPWDDMAEGRPLIVEADTPQEAVRKATELQLDTEAEDEGIPRSAISGGIHWKVCALNPLGFQGVEWERGVPIYDSTFVWYFDPTPTPVVSAPVIVYTLVAVWATLLALTYWVSLWFGLLSVPYSVAMLAGAVLLWFADDLTDTPPPFFRKPGDE